MSALGSSKGLGWGAAVFYCTLSIVVLSPLPLGSNRTWAIALLAMAMLSCTMLAMMASAFTQASQLRSQLKQAWLPLLLLALLAVLQMLQIWGASSANILHSEDVFQTQQMLLCTAIYAGAFVNIQLTANAQRIERAMRMLMLSGVAQAVLALLLFSGKAQYQFMHLDIHHGDTTIGSFVNRNHFACYMYLCLSMGIGLMVKSMLQQPPRPKGARHNWKHILLAFIQFMLSGRGRTRLLLIVMVIALVLTRSRMGNAAFVSAVCAAGVLAFWRFKQWRRASVWFVASLLVVDLLVVGQWVGLEKVTDRLQETALLDSRDPGTGQKMIGSSGAESVEHRTEVARLTVPQIQEHPWFGSGAGTFFTVFPAWKTPEFPAIFDHAHNDYAEIAADMGLVGLLLFALLVASTALRSVGLLRENQRTTARALGLGSCMVIAAVLMHSFVDFNLQIPANALTVVVIFALVWATPMLHKQTKPQSVSTSV